MKKITWEKQKIEEEEEETSVKDYPFRMLKMDDLSDSFNLWVAHTNFDITVKDVEKLDALTGIESLDIYSRYRMRVGIGKLFNEEKIKENIAYILKCSSNILEYLTEEVKAKVDELMKSFEDEENWVILVLPNADIITFVSKEEEKFIEKLTLFEKIQEITSCQLISSRKN